MQNYSQQNIFFRISKIHFYIRSWNEKKMIKVVMKYQNNKCNTLNQSPCMNKYALYKKLNFFKVNAKCIS